MNTGGDPAQPTIPGVQKRVAFSRVLSSEKQRVDESYFDSYSYFDIHREMLADKVRLARLCLRCCCTIACALVMGDPDDSA